MREYLIFLAQQHPSFRVAELDALADLHNIKIDLSGHDEENPFLIVQLEDDIAAANLIERAILSRGIYELWGMGATQELLHEDVKTRSSHRWEEFKMCTFKFDVLGFRGKRTTAEKVAIMEQFQYLPLEGPINLKKPNEIFTVLEHYEAINEHESTEKPVMYYFGRQIALSARSHQIVEKYDLKKRKYIGTTTFEAELALVSCNLAQVRKRQLLYDPFAGTGSFLVAGGHFGALTIGSDIDGRMIKGKGNNTIPANFKQYNMSLNFLDVMAMDFTHNAFRDNLGIDVIVCDPPYGIREGLKVLGARDPEKFVGKEKIEINGMKSWLMKTYIPTKKPYELDNLLYDLLNFASERLPIGGRLAFWMPTANDNFEPTIIPQHKNLELKYHLVQEFNKWSRRLLVYINRGAEYNGQDNRAATSLPEFRKMYFRASKTPTPEPSFNETGKSERG
ncbi:hypothetical protein BON22_0383 [Cyberlindnera fabianii]|uniref:tRNA (guanine(10)-N(2))-methyltransferase n=1 Tax=Cyberlindnera fabianii TaxID=36022 RepID=A0A1V2LDS2_CYBFA|nr:hypothetical protein BON22_0383 [Cyberlindnera fabianii]